VATLSEVLSARTREATLVEPMADGWVRCVACGHACRIPPGGLGVCKVRFNRDGRLFAPWGYVAGTACDPIEKKPFFHAWPGCAAYSFGMLGCDLHCSYCQNWITSQALRDPSAVSPPSDASPGTLVREALRRRARVLVSTYNEPLITAEWAHAIFSDAREAGLATGFVSNGHATPQAVAYLTPVLDLFKIDLKTFRDREYRKLGGRLQPVLDTIQALHSRGVWVEVVTLLVPGLNDSAEELRDLTAFVAGVSPDIPWHVTAFHADYKMQGSRDTTARDLLRAAGIGRDAGLHFVYAGNMPGRLAGLEDTRCPGCGETLVEREGYRIGTCRLTPRGTCPSCGRLIPGRWN
jgi:pyruvate formate lyase activating enzyme